MGRFTPPQDFAAFLKKRSSLEQEHAQGLKKLCRATFEGIRRPDHRDGSYAQQYAEFVRTQEHVAEHGALFAQSLHHMHDELVELTENSERGRKQWKQTGLSAEKRSQDAELQMEKAKMKYDALAEEFDRARTGDRHPGKKFGLKGPRSAAQLEDELQRKVQIADSDYQTRVQTAKAYRHELVTSSRPKAAGALQDLIRECDSALVMQMQKFGPFASFEVLHPCRPPPLSFPSHPGLVGLSFRERAGGSMRLGLRADKQG